MLYCIEHSNCTRIPMNYVVGARLTQRPTSNIFYFGNRDFAKIIRIHTKTYSGLVSNIYLENWDKDFSQPLNLIYMIHLIF